MTIAILGASGAVGSWVSTRLLEAGEKPRLIVRNSFGNRLARRADVDIVRCDFLDTIALTKALVGADAVINCVIDKNPNLVEADLVPQNVKVMQSIIDAVTAAQVPTFVHVSSIVVKPPRLSETTRQHLWEYSTEGDWYTRAKIATEKLLRKSPRPFAWTLVRAGIITGPESGWSSLGFGAHKDIVCLPETEMSLCHVIDIDDLARLLIHLAKRHTLPPVVYGINPEVVTWEKFYHIHATAIEADLILLKRPLTDLAAHAHQPSFWQDLLPWGAKSPFVGRAIRNPAIFKLAKKVVQTMGWQFLLEGAPRLVPGTRSIAWPAAFRLDQYCSDAIFSAEETGATDGFTYRMSFQDSVDWAAKWWRASNQVAAQLPTETKQLLSLARRPIR